ncbi:MAG: peptidylprolyl isomerase [Verrucomicrobia bacterium]|nr:peptidylprolyl isomerase [Verrucomicrobiota bacterium]MBO7525105.1 peptidylprolyl isomerase [Verrucomicrobiota bacterium]MBP5760176.1 peptidylprolyl isomerase [Verrucomicrobiota bacterium]
MLLLSGCSEYATSKNPVEKQEPAAAAATQTEQKAAPGAKIAVIETDKGTMTLELWSDVAPNTVANFEKLANEKFYDTTAFHRIIDGFMIQGGCPNTKPGGNMALAGTGDPGYKIKAEFNDRHHVRGVISMARSQDPDSAGCQFFICTGDATFLDGKYTCFGKLISGDDVLEKIAKTPVEASAMGEKSKPTERVEVKSIRVTEKK